VNLLNIMLSKYIVKELYAKQLLTEELGEPEALLDSEGTDVTTDDPFAAFGITVWYISRTEESVYNVSGLSLWPDHSNS
jgi:hypothetical protein